MSRATRTAFRPILHSLRSRIGSPSRRGDRAAFIASYGQSTRFSRSVVELTRALSARGYDVVIVRASDTDSRPEWPSRPGEKTPTIIFRENVGYDFGSWALGLHEYPKLAARKHVILANDSIVGPFASMDRMIDHFESSSADMWGAVSTLQFGYHLQSYFIGFHHGVLQRYPLKRFWQSVRPIADKQLIISLFEIGLTRAGYGEMLTIDEFVPAEVSVIGEQNPSIAGWKVLLDEGFPFVKRELLMNPQFDSTKNEITRELQERYGVTVNEWFDDLHTQNRAQLP